MPRLNYIERERIERLFKMGGGCVLDFSNRTFEEFIFDVLNYNVYDKPELRGLSKAKILRQLIESEGETYVGKLFIELVNYMKVKKLISSDNSDDAEAILSLGLKMMGKITPKEPCSSSKNIQNIHQVTKKAEIFDITKAELVRLDSLQSQQRKGYAFERLLKNLFDNFGLDARSAYKTHYDQIDGSFIFGGLTVLLEAKYRSQVPSKDELILFENKLGHMSNITRGLFISAIQVENKTIDYFLLKPKRLIAMTVEEIYLMCHYKIPLDRVLSAKFRRLDETGNIFVHLSVLGLW